MLYVLIVWVCSYVFEHSNNGYALLVAASAFTTIVSKPTSVLDSTARIQLRTFALDFLYSKPNAPSYVIGEVTKLVTRISKLCWFDASGDDASLSRTALAECGKFLSGSLDHIDVGVQLLTQYVNEMNQPDSIQGLSKHRKV